MKDVSILYPVFVQVALTFGLQFWMARERFAARGRGEVKPSEPGVRSVFTGRAGQVSNSFNNNLEVPILFYAVVAFAMLTSGVDYLMVALAWAYVICRLVHALIHTTYNTVKHRFFAYLASTIVLITMWVKLFFHVSGV